MDAGRARQLFTAARLAHLATVGTDGRPRIVPCTFALEGDRLYTAVDHKPKTTLDLARIRDIDAHPDVTLIVDHYEEDWSQLWWVRVRGVAAVVEEWDERVHALRLLATKYPQYAQRSPEGPVIGVHVKEWRGWSGGEAPGGGSATDG